MRLSSPTLSYFQLPISQLLIHFTCVPTSSPHFHSHSHRYYPSRCHQSFHHSYNVTSLTPLLLRLPLTHPTPLIHSNYSLICIPLFTTHHIFSPFLTIIITFSPNSEYLFISSILIFFRFESSQYHEPPPTPLVISPSSYGHYKLEYIRNRIITPTVLFP